MIDNEVVKENADSLIGLLTDQCADLEKLLSLAREEAKAVGQGDFEEVLKVVRSRSQLGARLEIYQKQIAELRSSLNSRENPVEKNPIVVKIQNLITGILQCDAKTKASLAVLRNAKLAELGEITQLQRRSDAYSREISKGLSYNKSI